MNIIHNLPLLITVISALAGLIGWGAARIRKGYGLERDISHLKRDYQSLSDNSATLFKEFERRLDSVEKELAILRAVNEALIAQSARNLGG
ncbi:MAG: hypothetical protein AAGI69_12700 [Cyanobacteria bacterium P01_H01_bin.21]